MPWDRSLSLFRLWLFGWRNGSTDSASIPPSVLRWSAWSCGQPGRYVSLKKKKTSINISMRPLFGGLDYYENLCGYTQCTSLPWFCSKPSLPIFSWTIFNASCLAKSKGFWQCTNFTSGSWQGTELSLQLTFGMFCKFRLPVSVLSQTLYLCKAAAISRTTWKSPNESKSFSTMKAFILLRYSQNSPR